MIYRFKFKPETIEDYESFRPKIPIILANGEKAKEIIAIIDTGSDLVYIPREMAEYFELDLSIEEHTAKGINTEFNYQTAPILLKLKDKHKSYQKRIKVMVPVDTIHEDIILGTEFLKDFIVTLDYKKKTIKLSENSG